MKKTLKQKYISGALLLVISTALVKVISAVYKIPLTAYIGATGRGYFSVAYNLCLPVHAITMGAFPLAITKLVSKYNVKGDNAKIAAIKKASQRLFLIIGIAGLIIMLAAAKPYTSLIAASPKSIYTVLALAPSVLFSCLGASHRAFAEGFLDMKPTAISQMLDALVKMIFGLLFARLSMSYLYDGYLLNGLVAGISVFTEEEALSVIYPITSAFAMLGVTLGSIVSYFFVLVYNKINYRYKSTSRQLVKSSYNELLTFSCALVGATAVQSIANFIDTSSIQYCLSVCDVSKLARLYAVNTNDVQSYVFGIYALNLDFKNLIPSLVMALGVTAVPAVSAAYEGNKEHFSSLLTSIMKYTVMLSALGGVVLSLFSSEILTLFYGKSNPDIVENADKLLFLFGATSLPCALATTTVYCTQAVGFAKNTVLPFVLSAGLRLGVNYFTITNSDINILGTAFSNFAGFALIVICNIATLKRRADAKISIFAVFIKPVFCAFITYFAVFMIKNKCPLSGNFIVNFALNIVMCLLTFLILLILTKSVTPKELKTLK